MQSLFSQPWKYISRLFGKYQYPMHLHERASVSISSGTRKAEVRTHKRIAIIGNTGSGKTSFAKKLSLVLDIPHVELDGLNWQSNWTPAPDFVERVHHTLNAHDRGWIADGNNEKVREYVWTNATTVVWLDFSFMIVMWRLTLRTFRRLLLKETLWNGNKERWSVVFSWNSILLWGIVMYSRYKKEFPEQLKQPQYAHIEVIRLRSPKDADKWLRDLDP